MSMSQEEIESLMNGLDIADDEASEVATEAGDLDALVNEEVVEPEPEPEVAAVKPEPEVAAEPEEESGTVDNSSIDDLINSMDMDEPEQENVDAADIDELLASIDTQEADDSTEEVDASDIDELIASLDNVNEDVISQVTEPVAEAAPKIEEKVEPEAPKQKNNAEFVEEKIQSGIFPLPADNESKVVSQLTAVAEDSEEKASQIFDVLSFILDENAEVDSSVNKLAKFLEEQEKVLQTLTAKFPNVDVFSANLEMLNELKGEPQKIKDSLNKENNELFGAMELMQYHDINRQKIERVMSVIRKLSTYLNNIFEDDNAHKEIVVAKHISGDSTDDLVGDDDMDALIAEFGN